MEGTINNKLREGLWKIYYESIGDLKESGEYLNDKRSGLWKTFFEDGALRGEIEYSEDHGYFEYYHSGKVMAEGPKAGAKNVGHWRYFSENSILESEGDYSGGRRNGEWKNYYPSGKVSSEGRYENDEPMGLWKYYFEGRQILDKEIARLRYVIKRELPRALRRMKSKTKTSA